MTISAKIIADSVSPQGIRLTTMQITVHRYVLAEFNTHRMFSRNFRSSRAVPVKKMIEEVRNNPAMPVAWLKNKPGMQGGEAMSFDDQESCRVAWLRGSERAAEIAELLAGIGLHKQWASRGLEPYLYVHGVVTATDYANFYALRRHADAQPEMKALADAMWEAQQDSEPVPLQPGQWHLPYVTAEELFKYSTTPAAGSDPSCVEISVARCARVSYLTHNNMPPSVDEDLALYGRLVGSAPIHASPAEHQATPDRWLFSRSGDSWELPDFQGNLRGWVQYRKLLPNEVADER